MSNEGPSACPAKREPGVPWSKKTGNPSGSPHSATVSVRPSAAATVCVPDAPGMTASSRTVFHGGKLVLLVEGHCRTLAQPTAVRVSNLLFAPLFGPIPVGGKSKD